MKKKKTLLWLDDFRDPKEPLWQEWIRNNVGDPHDYWIRRATNFDNFCLMVEMYWPDVICFDHDLADEHYVDVVNKRDLRYDEYDEKTGYDAAKWLTDYCQQEQKPLPEFHVQSANPVGAENIRSFLNNYKKHVENDSSGNP